MFIIASTGRCGTQAICDAYGRFSDHRVRHEPEPLLLAEAQRAHHGQWRYSTTYLRRMGGFARLNRQQYGESVRCAPLVADIARVAPSARVVVLFRDPVGYVRSAWGRGVMRKGDQWDRWRILPADAGEPPGYDGRSVTDLIGLHYAEVNQILAATAERLGDRAMVVELGELDVVVDRVAQFTDITITDRAGMAELLSQRPNAGPTDTWGGGEPGSLSPQVLQRANAAYRRLVSLAER